MKNSTRTIPVIALAVLALLMAAPLSSSALALDYGIEYHPTSGYVYFWHTGGVAEGEYTIEATDPPVGCIDFDGAIPVITGVAGEDSVKLACVPEEGRCGFVNLGYCRVGVGCLDYYDFYFRCMGNCEILQVVENECKEVPSVSEWGLLVLLALLLVSGAYVIRRKRAMATR